MKPFVNLSAYTANRARTSAAATENPLTKLLVSVNKISCVGENNLSRIVMAWTILPAQHLVLIILGYKVLLRNLGRSNTD